MKFSRLSLFVASTVVGLGLAGCASNAKVSVSDTSIIVQGYEFGPDVPKLVVKLTDKVAGVEKGKLKVSTAGADRQVKNVYLSDESGKEVKQDSEYVTIQMNVSFDEKKSAGKSSPFTYDLQTLHNNWSDSYKVSIKDLTVTSGSKKTVLNSEKDVIKNRKSSQLDLFTNKGKFSGTYENPITHENDDLTLHYAAYEPKSLAKGNKNPLLIWLHGQGEGGTDTDITLLGNEVVALAEEDIQNHFVSGNQKGAYVLAVQTPTYWMDEGDGTNGAGAGTSRYTDILMDTIKDYVSKHPDVDTSRIYLAGCSNGGYMTLNLAINNPEYFAALVPQATAYSYYQYERNEDGTYQEVPSDTSRSGKDFVRTDVPYFDESKIATIKDIPIWFIHAANDTIVNPNTYVLPVYKALLESGAKNKWFSYYESVEGSDFKGTSYMGHWSWIYFFNNKVSGVQDTDKILKSEGLSGFEPSNNTLGGSSKANVDGKEYQNVFDWLNAQKK